MESVADGILVVTVPVILCRFEEIPEGGFVDDDRVPETTRSLEAPVSRVRRIALRPILDEACFHRPSGALQKSILTLSYPDVGWPGGQGELQISWM